MEFAIIAAGDGSRLQSEGLSVAKPLADINGRPMIGRLLDIMGQCGADTVRVVVNGHSPEVAQWLLVRKDKPGVELKVKTTPDSMHTFAEATEGFTESFIVTTVDTIFSPSALKDALAAFEADPDADGYMGVTDYIDDEKPLYVTTDSAGRITAFLDSEPDEGATYVSAGIYILRPSALAILKRCLADGTSRMRNFQRALLSDSLRLKAWPMGKVIDVDHLSDLATACELDNRFNTETNSLPS